MAYSRHSIPSDEVVTLTPTPPSAAQVITGTSSINVSLVSVDYEATLTNYYIGATGKGITITLPFGVAGKVIIVKNQNEEGTVKVQGSGEEKLDNVKFKTLGSESSLIAVFDGTRWNLI